MKTKAKFLLCFAATCFAFVGAIQAQVLTGYQTVMPIEPSSGFGGTVTSFNKTANQTQGEVFTNILAIDSMTYVLFTTGSVIASDLKATFGEWNTSTNSFVGTTLDWTSDGAGGTNTLAALSVQAQSNWTNLAIEEDNYDSWSLSFDITAANGSALYTTDPTKTYALMITNLYTGGSQGKTNYGIGRTNSEADFAYGYSLIGNLGSNTFVTGNQDFTFSQISIVPYVAPTPESGTVAAIVGAVLVAGLVGFRLRQRRQLALVPVAA